MRIVLWRGFHEGEGPNKVGELIAEALEGRLLLILCPPEVRDFSFLDLLPEGELDWQGDWNSQPAARRASAPFNSVQPCLGIFTSATSENAKLVLYARENVECSARNIFALFSRRRITELFCYPQPFHTFGLTLGYAAAHLFGIRLVAPEGKYSQQHHHSWLSAVAEGTLTLGTPTHFLDLVQFIRETGSIPPISYSAIVGGARVSRALWFSLRDELRIEAPSIGYGATEASPGISHLPPGVAPLEDGDVGKPLPELQIQLDPGLGLRFAGRSLCAAIIQEGKLEFPGSFLLPDLLREREDGNFIYEGRAKFVLNRGGKKVQLEGLEKAISAQFGIEALCLSVPHARLGEELGILLKIPAEELDGRREPIFEYLRERYGANFSSEYMQSVRNFPFNANLKPDRQKALALLANLQRP